MIRSLMLGTALMGFFAQPALAEEGDWLVRARAINVAPQVDAGNVQPGFPTGSVDIDDAWVPEVDFTYFFKKNWAAELILATSPHDLQGTGALSGLGKIADVKTLPPTLTIQYHFAPDAEFRPYVGAGLNYTIFYDADASASLTRAVGNTKIDLDDSFGFAVQAGFDYQLNETWFMNMDVKYIDMNTTAELKSGANVNKVDVDINPIVFGIGVGRKF